MTTTTFANVVDSSASVATTTGTTFSTTIDKDIIDVNNNNDDDDDEDSILFGSMNAQIADALADRIEVNIHKGVQSLPLLKDPTKSKELVDTIHQKYMRNVDVIETYGSRNIFSIQQHPPSRRQRILQAFLSSSGSSSHDKEKPTTADTTTTATTTANSQPPSLLSSYPSKDQIPLPHTLAELQLQVQQLQTDLSAARAHRNTLLTSTKSLEVAQRVSETATAVLPAKFQHNVQGPVTAAVMGGQGVQELTREAQQLLGKLEERKRERSDDDDDEEEDDEFEFEKENPIVKKKKRLSLVEEYRQERKVATMDSLAAVRRLLKPK
jgi:hypothetical protein